MWYMVIYVLSFSLMQNLTISRWPAWTPVYMVSFLDGFLCVFHRVVISTLRICSWFVRHGTFVGKRSLWRREVMKGKSSAVTHDENDYFIKNNGNFSLFFWNFLRKNFEKYKKNSGIFFNLKKWKKTTHNNSTTWVHFLEKYNVKL